MSPLPAGPKAGRRPRPALARRLWGAGAAATVTGTFLAWLAVSLGGQATVRGFDDTVTALAALAAAAACARAGLRSPGPLRPHWLLLAGACSAWALAEVTWEVYDVVLRTRVPVPSWADLGYLGAIPLAGAALVAHPAMRRRRPEKVAAVLDGLVLASALLFLSWSFVLGPLWRSTDLSTLGGAVAVAYPFGDVVLVFLAVMALRPLRRGERGELWCVLGGLVAMALTDSTYTYLVERGSYSTGNLVDTGWVVAYLALALGAFGSGLETAGAAARSPAEGHDAISSAVAPFVPVLVALGALAVDGLLGHHLDRAGWAMALALSLLAVLRQAVGFWGRLAAPGRAVVGR